jgi:CRISPR-associated protein Cas2
MVLERAPAPLRGELSRWLIEPRAGVFIGSISAMVRDRLWEKCTKRSQGGAVLQIWATNNEQGFAARSYGDTQRRLIDWEGLWLVRLSGRPERAPAEAASPEQI